MGVRVGRGGEGWIIFVKGAGTEAAMMLAARFRFSMRAGVAHQDISSSLGDSMYSSAKHL